MLLVLAGCNTLSTYQSADAGDFYQVTATASYRPVSIPGTQRRVAQTEAEDNARRQILEHVGSMPVIGGPTVNDVMARDSRVRSQILGAVRTSQLVSWSVNPECGAVQVWMRLDLNRIRAIVSGCK